MNLTDDLIKKKLLTGLEVKEAVNRNLAENGIIHLQAGEQKYSAEVLELELELFHVRNTLSRESIFEDFRNQPIAIQIPIKASVFVGVTRLTGLGMVKSMHTLKLVYPATLKKKEHRKTYRLNHFHTTPQVNFYREDLQLRRASLIDISMTGAGIRLLPGSRAGSPVQTKEPVSLDIMIGDEIRLQGLPAVVMYASPEKIGVKFRSLSRQVRDALFDYIVRMRRQLRSIEEQQKLRTAKSQVESGESVAEPKEDSPARPRVLIIGQSQLLSSFLSQTLNRRFDVQECPFSMNAIQNSLQRQPSLFLVEIKPQDPDQSRLAKKIGAQVLAYGQLMYFGEGFTEPFKMRFQAHAPIDEVLLDLAGRKTLATYKKIDSFFRSS